MSPGGGALVIGISLQQSIDYPGLGPRMVGAPGEPISVIPITGGQTQLPYLPPPPPTLEFLGKALVFQAWDAEAGFGVPMVAPFVF
jgi:hypothetical protein